MNLWKCTICTSDKGSKTICIKNSWIKNCKEFEREVCTDF